MVKIRYTSVLPNNGEKTHVKIYLHCIVYQEKKTKMSSMESNTPQLLYNTVIGAKAEAVLVKKPCYIETKCIDYIEK